MPPEQELDHYRNLYKIEHAFRSFKTYLETRPMFHWTDKRIEGHICLCYIAYALLSSLQLRLQKKNYPLSENTLRKLIAKMQLSHIRNGKREFYLRSKNCDQTRSMLHRLGIKPLPAIIPNKLIVKYL
jgi:transposase